LPRSRADTARYTALKERNFVSEEKVNDIRTNEAAATGKPARQQGGGRCRPVAALLHHDSRTDYRHRRRPAGFSRLGGQDQRRTLLAVDQSRSSLAGQFSRSREDTCRNCAKRAIRRPQSRCQSAGDTRTFRRGGPFHRQRGRCDSTGTILLKAELGNEDEKLTPGQFLNVSLLLEHPDKRRTVPNEAVQQGADGNYLYTVKEDSRSKCGKIETCVGL
jgi:membrane fusion protein, multidrug efflux system